MDYNFSSLPVIDEVRLHLFKGNQLAHYISITGEAAQQIAALWRELPSGEALRSLLSPVVITFHFEGKGLVKSLISRESNRALIHTREGEEYILPFDGASPQASQLFELLQSL